MARRMILVAIGANLPGDDDRLPLDTCRWAARRLAAMPAVHAVALSRWYSSDPVPPGPQPDYVNGVIRFDASLDPVTLLGILHDIEAETGRIRGAPNAARTLDLDLLAVDDLVIDTATLVLPHPRLELRAFVLAPLCDVAPGWRHPRLGRTAAELLVALPDAGAAKPLPSAPAGPI